MELISLNTWGGRLGSAPLQLFFEKYKSADIFCLQEIWQAEDKSQIELADPRINTDLLHQISQWLPEFRFFFRPQYRGIYGLATFVRRDIKVLDEGELFVFKEQGYENPAAIGNHARNIQFLQFQNYQIINFHGLWNGLGKNDSDDRILQSNKIAAFCNGPTILAGDFNLNPESQSMKILEGALPRNLVKEFGIVSTRSSHYPKPGKFADYILTTPGIQVRSFEVLPDEVSDHLALRLGFE